MTVGLESLRSLDEATMPIVPPGYSQAIGSIVFAGPGHEKTVAADAKMYRWRSAFRGRAAPYEVAVAMGLEEIADRIIAWSGLMEEVNGNIVEIKFTPRRAVELLADRRLSWLAAQCRNFLDHPATFAPR